MKLAQPPLLRPLVTEHRTAAEYLERQFLAEPPRDERPRHAGGRFRPQGDPLAPAVVKGVHLLGDDVGGLAERALEHLGELEHRRRHFVIPRACRHGTGDLDHVAVTPVFIGQQVTRAADRL